MQVSMLDTKRQYEAIREQLLAAAERVLSSGCWIGGAEIKSLEEKLAGRFGCDHAVGVASGTDALLLSLKALGVGPDTDVVVPTYTFFATAGAVANCGARPIFADIEADSFNIDPESFESVVTEKTRVVIPVDLFGHCADYNRIRAIAETRGITVLEDAAQAIGATYDGRPAGSLGDAGTFSFYPTKNLGGCGDGGMVSTNNPALASTVRKLAAHGSDDRYHHGAIGTNSRLDPLQAAMLLAKLEHLDSWQASRAKNAAFYTENFVDHPALEPPKTEQKCSHVYHQYVLRVTRGSRDDLKDHLQEHGIGSAVYYPLSLHLQECFSHLGGRPGDCPIAEEASKTTLALPVHPDLDVEHLEHVASQVLAWADRQL